MRPDRIVVGEVRDGAALDMLQAMNTGHDGSITTVHANSPRDSLSRLETMVLMAGVDLPVRAIREQVAGALDLIIQQARLKDGSRRIVAISEVVGMEGEVITLQDLFTFDFSAGRDESGRFRGQLVSTGLRPKFAQDLARRRGGTATDLVRQRCAMIAGPRGGRVGWRACSPCRLFAVLDCRRPVAAEEVPASLSDLRATEKAVTATLVLRGDKAVVVDPKSVKASVGGELRR